MNRLRSPALAAAAAATIIALGLAVTTAGPVRAQGPNPPEAQGVEPAAATPLGTTFTYQGQLKRQGSPYDGVCDLQFGLWDSASAGSQMGSTLFANGVQVEAGLFTVRLDFGNQFTGGARWLETAVQCSEDAGFTALSPRQPLDAVPYALGLRPGATVNTTTANVAAFTANAPAANANAIVATGNGNGYAVIYGEDTSPNGGSAVEGKSMKGQGVYGIAQTQAGVKGESDSGDGVWGHSEKGTGVSGTTRSTSFAAIRGISLADAGTGVSGASSQGSGVKGSSTSGAGVQGKSEEGAGVLGESTNGPGVSGLSTNQAGLTGKSQKSVGVKGESSTNDGILGTSLATNHIGVKGVANAPGSVGVWGQSNANTGVYGLSTDGIAVWGQSANGPAMRADGNAVQARDKGGWVKAMAYVGSDGTILRCYNGVTGATANSCGFTGANPGNGTSFVIDFGFNIADRFASVTGETGIELQKHEQRWASITRLEGTTAIVESGYLEDNYCGGPLEPTCKTFRTSFYIFVY